jgi:hypothetical protein
MNSMSTMDALNVLSEIVTTYKLGTGAELQNLMESTHTVISGSWTLYALFPNTFHLGDLDFYISKTH